MSILSKREAVIVLLRSRDDEALSIPTSTGRLVARSATPGESFVKRVQCPRCEGSGKHGKEKCGHCLGQKRLLVDPVTGRDQLASSRDQLSSTSALTRREKQQRDDNTIRTLEHRRQVEAGAEGTDDPWTRALAARERRERLGSYRELHACLLMLAEQNRLWHAALVGMYGAEEGFRDLSASFTAAAEHGLALVVEWMPDPVRVPPWLLDGGARGFSDRQRKRGAAA